MQFISAVSWRVLALFALVMVFENCEVF